MAKNRSRTSIIVRLDDQLLELVEDVQHALRYKSREAAMRAMLEAGAHALVDPEDRAKMQLVREIAARAHERRAALEALAENGAEKQKPKHRSGNPRSGKTKT